VFAAFASAEAKNVWGDTGDLEPAEGAAGAAEFDFRPGGRERFGFKWSDTTYRYDALYYDIVPGQRIIYSYEMYADEARISVSVATIEFAKNGDGAADVDRTGSVPGRHRRRPGARTPQTGHHRDARRPNRLSGLSRCGLICQLRARPHFGPHFWS
jgi:uncharacterized protein YndB with AHSA1/START domain